MKAFAMTIGAYRVEIGILVWITKIGLEFIMRPKIGTSNGGIAIYSSIGEIEYACRTVPISILGVSELVDIISQCFSMCFSGDIIFARFYIGYPATACIIIYGQGWRARTDAVWLLPQRHGYP